MKKISQSKKIGEVINSFYKDYGLLRKETDESVFDIWEKLIGIHISSKTDDIVLKKNVIYIYVKDEIIKKELIRQKNKLKEGFLEKIQNLKAIEII